jgi:hypothetical protein
LKWKGWHKIGLSGISLSPPYVSMVEKRNDDETISLENKFKPWRNLDKEY